MRPLFVFIFSLLSVLVAIFLLIGFSSWSMAEFDCAKGYFVCRENWFRNEGIWLIAMSAAWASGAIWLYRTREKN
ncbi:MAG: hypothetical protein LH466_02015 [Sphingomonas bacterium]|nr:hypothetical protein [Sphingomonas bacterium]